MPTKLRDGKFFSRVCLSLCSQLYPCDQCGPDQTYSLQKPTIVHLEELPPPQTCLNLLNYVAQTYVPKWVVDIQLKCLLVSIWKGDLKRVDRVGGMGVGVDSRMGVVDCNNCDIWNDSRILRCGFRIKVWIIPLRRIFHENRSLWLFHYDLIPT